MEDRIVTGLVFMVVLLFSLSLHESAHAWAAHRMGDDTAMRLGRVSLNPVRHIDPVGTLLIPIIMFFTNAPLIGWAKPTPVNPANYRRLARGHVLVSAAGPASNLALALICAFVLVLLARMGLYHQIFTPLVMILQVGILLNVLLMVFNLIPLPPLDGSWIVSWGLPRSMTAPYDRVMETYGQWILLALVVTGLLGRLLEPIVDIMTGLISLLIRMSL
jgi:Zn-dependent protease